MMVSGGNSASGSISAARGITEGTATRLMFGVDMGTCRAWRRAVAILSGNIEEDQITALFTHTCLVDIRHMTPQKCPRALKYSSYALRAVVHIDRLLSKDIYYWQTRRSVQEYETQKRNGSHDILAHTRMAVVHHRICIDVLCGHFVHATTGVRQELRRASRRVDSDVPAVGRVRKNVELPPSTHAGFEPPIYRHRVVQELVGELESYPFVIARQNFCDGPLDLIEVLQL